jgi:antirestriction protein ArdC
MREKIMTAINYVTGVAYSGNNELELMESGYSDLRFLTFNQARSAGLKIKKGSTGIRLVRVVKVDKKTASGKIEKKPVPKYFTVFNISQTEEV